MLGAAAVPVDLVSAELQAHAHPAARPHPAAPRQDATTGAIDSRSQRASDVIRASSCCCPITWMPTGRPPTLISGTVTAGANSIELGALKTKSPVGRGARGRPGTSPGQSGAGPGHDSVITASASG